MNLLELRREAALKQGAKSGIAIVRDPPRPAGGPMLELDLGGKIEKSLAIGIEREPRDTVLKMLTAKKMDENFTFKVAPGEADNYIQAMRQVLSRTRKKAKSRKMPLDEFKVLRVAVDEQPDFDLVTLVRTKTLDAHQASVYDDLMAAFSSQNKREE